ncbi:unnamed protein product, partial [Mesorhabditis belari]|uniref:Methyltransferase domain-containing protein n=1 Tax=Mesorhabditis belari TaxID=2138241 RepID=A0AAF3JC52_9BILA
MSATREIYVLVAISIVLFLQILHIKTLTREIHTKVYNTQKSVPISQTRANQSRSCRLDDAVLEMYKIQHDKRVNLMKYAARVAGEQRGYAKLYNGIVPEVFCPSLVRIGNVDDGGKWVCNPMAMPSGCAIMSLGVAGDPSFEKEMQLLTKQKCSVQSYDKRDPGPVIEGMEKINAFFTKALISVRDDPENNIRSIQGEMKRLNIDRIEILKIDIEGSEFSVIPELISVVDICQILIEIHGKPKKVIELISEMARKGYRIFSYEINGAWHHLSEYSFIHESCIEQYEATPLDYYWHLV